MHEVRQGVPRAYESVRDVRGSSQKSEGIQKYLRESRGSSHRSYGDHRGQTELVEVRRSSQGHIEDRGSP